MVKKYADNPSILQSALKELNEIQVFNKKLHEIKKEILVEYTGEIEMFGRLKNVDQTREIHIRFRNITDYKAYIKAIGHGYESVDAIFNG